MEQTSPRVLEHLALLACLAICACRPPGIVASESESESGFESESGSGSETETGDAPDLPPEPECPAALGELVECACAYTEDCSLASADGSSCDLACDPPSPCDTVVCEFDIAYDQPACVELTTPEAFDCALAALLDGSEVQVTLTLDNTYPFQGWTDHHTLARLDGERFLLTHDKHVFYDAGPSPAPEWGARAAVVSAEQLLGCANEDFAEARFACLFGLWFTAEACADLDAWQCPP
jgi:hypothetical protein